MPNADYECLSCGDPVEMGFVDYSDTPGYVHVSTGETLCDPDKEDSPDAVPVAHIDSYPACSEGDHPNDDNPGKPTCKTCEDWT